MTSVVTATSNSTYGTCNNACHHVFPPLATQFVLVDGRELDGSVHFSYVASLAIRSTHTGGSHASSPRSRVSLMEQKALRSNKTFFW